MQIQYSIQSWIVQLKGEANMKKTIFLFLLLCLSLILIACNTTGNDCLSSDNSTTQKEDKVNGNFENTVVEQPNIEMKSLSVYSYEDYQKLVRAIKLPENFVKYEEISQFGEFDALVFLSKTHEGDYSSYMYGLKDSAGGDFVLYIRNYKEDSETAYEQITSVNSNDMRFSQNTSNCIYVTPEGVKYLYVSGTLNSITWTKDGLKYILFSIHDYPYTNETYVGKLLNLNTYKEAIQSLDISDEQK